MNTVIEQAIKNTPIDYLAKVLAMRNPGPSVQGSVFEKEQDPVGLSKEQWEPYEHPDIVVPAKGFKAPIPGYLGVVRIADLPDEELIHFTPSRKGTGFLDAIILVSAERAETLRRHVNYSVALVGPGDDGKDVLWTIHPGPPTPPSTMVADGPPEELAVPSSHALKLGLVWAKIEVLP